MPVWTANAGKVVDDLNTKHLGSEFLFEERKPDMVKWGWIGRIRVPRVIITWKKVSLCPICRMPSQSLKLRPCVAKQVCFLNDLSYLKRQTEQLKQSRDSLSRVDRMFRAQRAIFLLKDQQGTDTRYSWRGGSSWASHKLPTTLWKWSRRTQ